MRGRRQSWTSAAEETRHLSKGGHKYNARLALSAPKSSLSERRPEEAAGRRNRVNDIASEQLVSLRKTTYYFLHHTEFLCFGLVATRMKLNDLFVSDDVNDLICACRRSYTRTIQFYEPTSERER